MRLIRFAPRFLLLLALSASTALGQAQRTFVSGLGSDSNPCSRTAPCRTLAQAISQTSSGGEVLVLDSAGYGAFSINKSISIISPPGVYAGISVFSGDGIDVTAGLTDVVTLRGLSINNQGGSEGVFCNGVGTLRIESCVVRGLSVGIDFSGGSSLVVKDTVVSDCVETGVFISAGGAHSTLDHVTLARCLFALGLSAPSIGQTAATIRDSDLSGNGFGITVGSSGAPARLDAERCLITGGETGVKTLDATVSLSLSNCVITRNSAGFSVHPGSTIYTRGNNTILGNANNGGSLTPLPAQ